MPRRSRVDPLAAAVGRRVRMFRETNGLGLEKLAYESGLSSKGHLSDLEHGKLVPTIASLVPLADRLGVLLLDLVTFPEADDRQRLVDLTRGLSPEVVRRWVREAERLQETSPATESARPVEIRTGRRIPRGAIPVVEAAALPDPAPTRWVRLAPPDEALPGPFVARVDDDSMVPRIPPGSFGLFRRPAPGNRQGRVFLVAYRAADGSARYEPKYVEKARVAGRDRVVLRSLNPSRESILVDPGTDALRILGEFVRCVPVRSDRAGKG